MLYILYILLALFYYISFLINFIVFCKVHAVKYLFLKCLNVDIS